MTNWADEFAILLAIHSDILLPGEEQRVAGAPVDTLPATAERRFVLRDERSNIGRSWRECVIRVAKHRLDISRTHATIVRSEAGYVIEDHSSLGTFVNGQQVAGLAALQSGDVIGFASSREMLLFKLAGAGTQADQLTERERDILHLVALGQSNKQIALALHVTTNTVKAHLKSIFDKLDVSNRTEAANAARRRGLL